MDLFPLSFVLRGLMHALIFVIIVRNPDKSGKHSHRALDGALTPLLGTVENES
jgi:hypothetical protein